MECNMENHLKKVHCKKVFFLKSFIVSIIVLIIAFALSMFMYESSMSMVERMYGMSSEDYAKIFVLLFGFWKILIFQFTLVPFIVLAMIEGHIKKHHMENKM